MLNWHAIRPARRTNFGDAFVQEIEPAIRPDLRRRATAPLRGLAEILDGKWPRLISRPTFESRRFANGRYVKSHNYGRLHGAFQLLKLDLLTLVSSVRGNDVSKLLNAVPGKSISIAAKVFAPAGSIWGRRPGGAGACLSSRNPGHLAGASAECCAIARRRSTVGTLFGHKFPSKNVQYRLSSSGGGGSSRLGQPKQL